jgi:hypothetical protein
LKATLSPSDAIPNPRKRRFQTLLGALSGDEDEEPPPLVPAPSFSSDMSESETPWLQAYRGYIGPVELLPDGMGLIEWWGVS